ncbi:MAG: HRDC domain-containing protein [Ornithinimicrobium sp.]
MAEGTPNDADPAGSELAQPAAEVFDVLKTPEEGVPEVVADEAGLSQVIAAIGQGTGPVAVDAERASGYRYGQDAYLVQLRREGSGTHLIDPVGCPDLSRLDEALADTEWVLHAATQDIPCLTALGMTPRRLFDTELGARLAGLPRAGLSSVLEYYLGVTLAKEHSAVDWSTRPLPQAWLNYAALDVELLVPLRNRMAQDLREQGKLEWAEQEFAALTAFTGPKAKVDPWRRVTGTSKLRNRRALARLRLLWEAREGIAQQRDVTPGRILPDSTLIDLAQRGPSEEAALLTGTPDARPSRARRSHQGLRRYKSSWLTAIGRAQSLPESDLPPKSRPAIGPPPPRSWADRSPEAAERLTAARAGLAEISEHVEIPVENLLTPEVLRILLWDPPGETDPEAVMEALTRLGARPWQCHLLAPLISQVLDPQRHATLQ